MELDRSPEFLARNISEKAKTILREFESDELLNTRDLTGATNYRNQTVGYHIDGYLIANGLLAHEGYDESANAPRPPKVYRLTDGGRAVLGELAGLRSETMADLEQLDSVRDRVDELADTVRRLETENQRLREKDAKIEDRFENLKEHVGEKVS